MKATVERIERNDRSFTVYPFSSLDFDHPYHFHHDTELLFVTEGKGQVLVGNTTSDFEAGDIFLIGADVPHRFQSEAAGDQHPLCSYVLQFDPDCFGSLFTETPELSRIAKLVSYSKHGMVIRGAPDYLFAMMSRLMESQGVGSVINFLALLSAIDKYAQLEFIAPEQSDPVEVKATTKIGASIEWMDLNYHREIDLQELADYTNMNKHAFCRAFKAQTGDSPMHYINHKRIERAATLLLESHQGIADIGFAVGFPTVSSFNRNFKQSKGMSPRVFRKMGQVFTE